jgi:hypothetical protein
VPTGGGTYGLPGAQAHASTSCRIVQILAEAPDHRMDRDILFVMLKRSNDAFRKAIILAAFIAMASTAHGECLSSAAART